MKKVPISWKERFSWLMNGLDCLFTLPSKGFKAHRLNNFHACVDTFARGYVWKFEEVVEVEP